MKLHRPRPATARPLVSVVVPCYNYGHFLPEAVESALTQTGVELEVIIVDDCSTDDSATVAEALAAQHPEVTLIRNPVNLRHIATYNVGLAATTGDFVVLLSADDLLAPGALARAAAVFMAHPEVTLVYGQAVTFHERPLPDPEPARSWSTWQGHEWVTHSCRNTGNLIVNPEAIVRRSVLDRVGGYDPTFPHAADMLLWLQAACLGDVARVNGTQAYYRDHGGNMHLTDYAGLLTDMGERRNLLDAFLTDGLGAAIPDAAGLRDAAHRTFARESLRYALHELDGAGHPDQVDALVDFAVETWPGVRRTRLWAAVARRQRGRVPAWRAQAARRVFALRWALRWQRRHRWGT
ncbi:glycosyltransferase family 2 protein [Nocardioides currus]|uniref:Glycosyltransferase family 2 protein n=1 Tax=Nocardioides currus TaxID=2133958 RepID=A0A2R7Z2F2_9ACTN|nr:glycosyltransferase [Nocardioides currus]PUA82339.1 glycosyltransferase family 2 protein [Nocardioides currus]